MMGGFDFAAGPHIHFGAGRRAGLPDILRGFGTRVLLVTGAYSFDGSPMCRALLEDLQQGFELQRLRVDGEPSPSLVDEAVAGYRGFGADVVVAIGGGSTVDAAKAVAGLLPLGHSVLEYLEGVGRGRAYHGPATPFVALPTTAGTGGETSKNAVLSEPGEGGFKKSFRHELLVARHIILDPELTLSCPPDITAACGMDALTQLLESYVSTGANPMTDALAASGMSMVRDGLLRAVRDGDDLEARSGMLYASAMSGLTLANAGLGSVHGLASPLGAFFPIPHGVVCGTLVHEATRMNIACMQERESGNPALLKYAEAGRILLRNPDLDDEEARRALLDLLEDWTDRLAMPRLSSYGISAADIPRIVAGSRGNSMQTNPIHLEDGDLSELVKRRL
ncbi:MAG TPA: iron-containing alcohol dehydrogenase [Mariprofundaceae bacterium]|nr:iron-containing alcohol dehydrogenase [Mariprofundaceae bacterium]